MKVKFLTLLTCYKLFILVYIVYIVPMTVSKTGIQTTWVSHVTYLWNKSRQLAGWVKRKLNCAHLCLGLTEAQTCMAETLRCSLEH